MRLFKWCSFLTRTMSPLTVGLIWCCLIGVSSLSYRTQVYSSQPTSATVIRTHVYTSRPPSVPVIRSNNNASFSSFAKDHVLHRTKLIRGPAHRNSNRNSSSSSSIITSGSVRDTRITNRRLPKLHLNSTLNVRNPSKTNSTIIYFPRYSRSMGNFSKNYTNRELTPVIVSKKRRVLLDPKEYKVRRSSDALFLFQKVNGSSQFGLKSRNRYTQNSTITNQRKFSSKPSELPPEYLEATPTKNVQRLIKTSITNKEIVAGPKANFPRSKSSTGVKNSSVLQFLPVTRNSKENRLFPSTNRRRGRNFDISDEASTEKRVSLPGRLKQISSTPDTSTDTPKKFASTVHYFTAFKNSSPPNIPSASEISKEQSFLELRNSYTEKKAKNLTIYEILKPRLKSNASEIIDFSPNQNSYSLQNDAVYHQIQDITNVESNNASDISVLDDEDEINNNTFVTNEIEDKIANFGNRMAIIPGRSDSIFGIQYVMVNRNNFTITPQLNLTSLNGNFKSEQSEKDQNYTERTLSEDLGTDVDTEEIYKREGYVSEAAFLEKDILRQKKNDSINEQIPLIENSNKTSYNNTSVENLSADGSEYQTLLYESDSIRRPKMTETINNDNTPFKNPKIDSKIFYDYFAKKPSSNLTLMEFPYPEYRPGNMFRYSDIYQRKPILDLLYTHSTSILHQKTDPAVVTEETMVNPTTFNSLRTPVRVLSTYYPNRYA